MDRNGLFGGNPIGVIVRLIVLSIIVGIVMSALDIRPENIFYHVQMLIHRISTLGFGAFEGAVGYFLLGAVVVIPVWIIARILGALGGGGRGGRGE
ncbi:MAG: DUF6460 domain-containing protein [Hyphomicrobiaceae bacterium]